MIKMKKIEFWSGTKLEGKTTNHLVPAYYSDEQIDEEVHLLMSDYEGKRQDIYWSEILEVTA